MPNTPTPTARLADDAAYIAALVDLRDANATPTPDAQPERTCAGCKHWARYEETPHIDWGVCNFVDRMDAPAVVSFVLSSEDINTDIDRCDIEVYLDTRAGFSCAGWQAKESAT